jgi:hypothetical protein
LPFILFKLWFAILSGSTKAATICGIAAWRSRDPIPQILSLAAFAS